MITSSNQMKTFCLSLKFVFIYKYFKIKNLVSQSRTLTLSHTLFRSLPITHAYNHKALMSLTSQLTVDPPHKRCLTTFTHKQRQTHRASSLSWQQEICRHKDKLFREGGVAHMSRNHSLSEVIKEAFTTEASAVRMLLFWWPIIWLDFWINSAFVWIYLNCFDDALNFSSTKCWWLICREGVRICSSSSRGSFFSHTPPRVTANVLANLQPKHIPFPFMAISVPTSPLVCEAEHTRRVLDWVLKAL